MIAIARSQTWEHTYRLFSGHFFFFDRIITWTEKSKYSQCNRKESKQTIAMVVPMYVLEALIIVLILNFAINIMHEHTGRAQR